MTYYQVMMAVTGTAWAIAIIWIACLNLSWERNTWGRHSDVGLGYAMQMAFIGGAALVVTAICMIAGLVGWLSS